LILSVNTPSFYKPLSSYQAAKAVILPN